MQKLWIGLAGFSTLVLGTPTFAGTPHAFNAARPPIVSEDFEAIPIVSRGDALSIACDALQYRKPSSDVRVVLTISAAPGETSPGYKQVMATEEELMRGAVRVRVPNVPDIENHTINLDVYVINDEGSNKSCDAGHWKIS
ncbi:MAG: hypothetical protein GC166_09270 [Alphaproteobacteria bacterium]|nr:hypothetical protein [Alphaproteobacteria bacterium]